MENLIISMESTCDLPKDLIEKYDFKILPMDFIIDDNVYSSATDDVDTTQLYDKMKAGHKTSTSQVNKDTYTEFFENCLKQGKDVLHLAFSSGLSKTYDRSVEVAKELNEKYENKIYVVDSRCACSGHGLFGIICAEFAKTAKDINEIVEYAENMKYHINHDFTVDNLKYLANGGRIKASTAFVGNILKIKPIMCMDHEGRLHPVTKVISRRKSLTALYHKFMERRDPKYDYIYVSHADCKEDAMVIMDLIKNNTDLTPLLTNLGPVIGSHSGPGTISLFYVGEER